MPPHFFLSKSPPSLLQPHSFLLCNICAFNKSLWCINVSFCPDHSLINTQSVHSYAQLVLLLEDWVPSFCEEGQRPAGQYIEGNRLHRVWLLLFLHCRLLALISHRNEPASLLSSPPVMEASENGIHMPASISTSTDVLSQKRSIIPKNQQQKNKQTKKQNRHTVWDKNCRIRGSWLHLCIQKLNSGTCANDTHSKLPKIGL